jgi:hypothetical protein
MNLSNGNSPYEEFAGRHDPEREAKNARNVAAYFRLQPNNRVLHIGAGDNPYPESLPEDIEQYDNKRYPYLLAVPGEALTPYVPTGELFDAVMLINIRVGGKQPEYGQFFELAATVMKPGGTLVLAALDANHDSIVWAVTHENEIIDFGFTKVSPLVAGQTEDAPADIKDLPGSALKPGFGMVAFSNANAVRVVWQRN